MTFQLFQLVGRMAVSTLLIIMGATANPDYIPAFTFYCLMIQLLLLLGYANHRHRPPARRSRVNMKS